jgi:hypothetical protein
MEFTGWPVEGTVDLYSLEVLCVIRETIRLSSWPDLLDRTCLPSRHKTSRCNPTRIVIAEISGIYHLHYIHANSIDYLGKYGSHRHHQQACKYSDMQD